VAAYRIATEALTNVVRHADARHCHVRFGVDARSLEIQISDDGGGLDGTRPGVGMTSMRERAAELGGAYTAGPRAGGGTLVRASLPLTAA
jgi:signal transduction histidine kinase